MGGILEDIKSMLGIEKEDTAFDIEVLLHTNSAIATLTQLGVGPPDGYEVTGYTNLWSELLLERKDLNDVKSYIYIRVRLIYDPPANSYLVKSYEEQAKELEWRIEVKSP